MPLTRLDALSSAYIPYTSPLIACLVVTPHSSRSLTPLPHPAPARALSLTPLSLIPSHTLSLAPLPLIPSPPPRSLCHRHHAVPRAARALPRRRRIRGLPPPPHHRQHQGAWLRLARLEMLPATRASLTSRHTNLLSVRRLKGRPRHLAGTIAHAPCPPQTLVLSHTPSPTPALTPVH